MEKAKLTNNSKVESIRNKEKVGHKIESLWGENSYYDKNSKYESKKLMIRLETTGKEKRKITLKMECGSPNANSNNYSLVFLAW